MLMFRSGDTGAVVRRQSMAWLIVSPTLPGCCDWSNVVEMDDPVVVRSGYEMWFPSMNTSQNGRLLGEVSRKIARQSVACAPGVHDTGSIRNVLFVMCTSLNPYGPVFVLYDRLQSCTPNRTWRKLLSSQWMPS